ncbi:MAG TPA: HlyD family efflux transporter periplasmic adaptor subunit [Candidatus Eisenbacteria bacterium]|nr:HlyD family efflux transporter periplasmic adaptor subunit [Candidatus Eisenbacteria bacterium]
MIPRARRLAALLLLPLALAGCGRKGGDEGDAPEGDIANAEVPVHEARVTSRAFQDVVTGSGSWRASGSVSVAAPFAGTVLAVDVRRGDVVREGQRLATLVTRESQAAARGAALLEQESRSGDERREAAEAARLARRERVQVPLVSPVAGIVQARSAEPGSGVPEGGEVVSLVAWRSLVFEAHVSPADAARLTPGMPATIVDDPAGVRRTARVLRLLPNADPDDQTVLVWLAASPGTSAPVLDRFGTATIVAGGARRALAVPDSALVEDDLTGAHRVAVVDSSAHAHWRVVVPGALSADGWRELRAPAPPAGAPVVVQGQRGLPDGARVRPAP